MDDDLRIFFLKEIKAKSQIKDLKDSFIFERLDVFFLRNGDVRKKVEKEFLDKREKIVKSKNFKEVVKRIREEIGVIYGSFLTSDFNKKEKVLESALGEDDVLEVLKFHKSTRERFDYYDEIYKKIFYFLKGREVRKIADVACGLNPLSYFLMRKYLSYDFDLFAVDLNVRDMDFLNLFFKKFKINGVARAYDVTNLEVLKDKDFLECDTMFLFKAIDSFESLKKDVSKKIILGGNFRNIVVSFPTKSLVSKKDFKMEKRNWFFKFVESYAWEVEKFEVENELFIIIKK